jgi:hypothetical protein
MKKLIILLCSVTLLLLLFNNSIFSKNIHKINTNNCIYLNPPSNSNYNILTNQAQSPLLIWGQYNSLKDFHFTGNHLLQFVPQPSYFHVNTIVTYEKGNVILMLPRHFNVPASEYFSNENARILNSGN